MDHASSPIRHREVLKGSATGIPRNDEPSSVPGKSPHICQPHVRIRIFVEDLGDQCVEVILPGSTREYCCRVLPVTDLVSITLNFTKTSTGSFAPVFRIPASRLPFHQGNAPIGEQHHVFELQIGVREGRPVVLQHLVEDIAVESGLFSFHMRAVQLGLCDYSQGELLR